MEETIWDHSASDLSFNWQSLSHELNVFRNINDKNLQSLKNIEREITNSPALNLRSNTGGRQNNMIDEYMKKREQYEERKSKQVEVVKNLNKQEQQLTKNIDNIKFKIKQIENESQKQAEEKKQLRKSHKVTELSLQKIKEYYTTSFGMQVDIDGDAESEMFFTVKFSKEPNAKPVQFSFNKATQKISLVELSGINDKQKQLIQKYLHNENQVTPAFCVIHDICLNRM